MRAFYTDHFVLPLPPGHRFPMQKYRITRELVAQNVPELELIEPEAATDGQLALAHTPDYIWRVSTGHLSAAEQREIGFPWSPAMVERSRRSTGATIAACRSALHMGSAANLAGGTHHAYADKGSGFCVFNDAAVAARLMQAERQAEQRQPGQRVSQRVPHQSMQVAIIDLDVHQGNGTAAILKNDPSIFTLSLHGEKNFPFRKEVSDLDRALPDGTGDTEYLRVLELALEQLFETFTPDLIIYLAGADPYEGDRLGRLKLTHAGLAERDQTVFQAALTRGIPVAVVMAGGYGHVIEETCRIHARTIRLAADFSARYVKEFAPKFHT